MQNPFALHITSIFCLYMLAFKANMCYNNIKPNKGVIFMKPSNRTFEEIQKSARESFYEANGYYPTVKEVVKMVDEVREEIRIERQQKTERVNQ